MPNIVFALILSMVVFCVFFNLLKTVVNSLEEEENAFKIAFSIALTYLFGLSLLFMSVGH